MEEEFAEDKTYGPEVDCFCIFAGSEQKFWGTVPRIKVGQREGYQTVTTCGVIGLVVTSRAIPKSAIVSFE